MAAEPIFAGVDGHPATRAGFVSGPNPADVRGWVGGDKRVSAAREQTAVATTEVGAADKAAARALAGRSLEVLRNSGWTIYYIACVPPRPPDAEPPSPDDWPIEQVGVWSFTARAYKVIDGVSYAVDVGAAADATGWVGMSVSMRAPNGHEQVTDLFPDKPPAVDRAESCVESPVTPAGLIQTGVAIQVGAYAPTATSNGSDTLGSDTLTR